MGLLFIFGWIVIGLKRECHLLMKDYSTAILKFSVIVIVTLCSYTEVAFYGFSNMGIIFLLGIMSVPKST